MSETEPKLSVKSHIPLKRFLFFWKRLKSHIQWTMVVDSIDSP